MKRFQLTKEGSREVMSINLKMYTVGGVPKLILRINFTDSAAGEFISTDDQEEYSFEVKTPNTTQN